MDVDAPEASDSSIPAETAIQDGTTTRIVFDNNDEMEITEESDVETPGETPFSTDVSAHPVQIQDMNAHPVQIQDMTAHPVQGASTAQERPESATSLKFRDILQSNPRSPGSSPISFTPNAAAPIASPPTFETSSGDHTPPSVAPVPSSPSPKPIPQAPNPSDLKIHCVPRNPEWSHSLLNVSMDFIQGSRDSNLSPQFAALAVPSDIMAPVFEYIESLAEPGSDLSKITTDHPVIRAIIQRDAGNRPQLPSWQSRQPLPNSHSTMKESFVLKVRRQREQRVMQAETEKLKAENVRLKANATEQPHSTTLNMKTNETSQPVERPQRRTTLIPDPYTTDGQLLLGRTREIEVDEYGRAVNPADEPTVSWRKYIHNSTVMRSLCVNGLAGVIEARQKAQLEEARRTANVAESPYIAGEDPSTDGPALGGLFADSQDAISRDQVQPEQVPETPRARGWGLSSFLPSARSVTRYIPFSSRRAVATPQHQPSQTQHLAQTESRVDRGSSHVRPDPDDAGSVAVPGHHHRHPSTSNQQRLLTKNQSDEEKRIKRMRAQLRRDAEALEKQKRDFEIAKKDLAEQQKSTVTAKTPGTKRKRLPSPDIIPLPANGGYGLVDEYFVVDSSSDDEDAAAQETPTKERPFKKARTSAPDDPIVGNPFRARPYTGTLFAHPDESRSPRDDTVVAEPDKPDAYPTLDSTPPGPTLIFKVPSPGSSDSDDEEDEQEHTNKTTHEPSSSSVPEIRSILRNSPLLSNQSQQRSTANPSLPSKTMAPPPRPNPGHATLPAATALTPSGALEKARERALRHQPKQPSTLRESSRLSTSSVSSDNGGEEVTEEYDPAHPAIVQSVSNAPVFTQPATPAAAPAAAPVATPAVAPATLTFEQPILSPTAPAGFHQPVTQAGSKQPHEQQAATNASEKQPDNMYSAFAAAHADTEPSSAQQAVSAKKQNEDISDVDQFAANSSAKVKADLERYFKEHGDDYVLDEGYQEFFEGMLAEEQELIEGPNGLPYRKPRNVISAALDGIGADSLADRGIQIDVEENLRPGDLDRTESDPANGMRVFFNRLVKNGDIERGLADRVIAMGVPPGTAEYFAGQRAMKPVAA